MYFFLITQGFNLTFNVLILSIGKLLDSSRYGSQPYHGKGAGVIPMSWRVCPCINASRAPMVQDNEFYTRHLTDRVVAAHSTFYGKEKES